jgi:hypothetical protein
MVVFLFRKKEENKEKDDMAETGQPHVRGCPGLTCSDRCFSSPSRWGLEQPLT